MKTFLVSMLFLILFTPLALAFEDCNKMKGEERQMCRIANNLEINIMTLKTNEQLNILKIQTYRESADNCKQIDLTLQKQFKEQKGIAL